MTKWHSRLMHGWSQESIWGYRFRALHWIWPNFSTFVGLDNAGFWPTSEAWTRYSLQPLNTVMDCRLLSQCFTIKASLQGAPYPDQREDKIILKNLTLSYAIYQNYDTLKRFIQVWCGLWGKESVVPWFSSGVVIPAVPWLLYNDCHIIPPALSRLGTGTIGVQTAEKSFPVPCVPTPFIVRQISDSFVRVDRISV